MSNLDILLNHYIGISQIPVCIRQEAGDTWSERVCRFYGDSLEVETGCAGYVITDEYLFVGKVVEKDTGVTVLLGPATEYALTGDTILRIRKQLGTSAKDARGLHTFLSELPLMPLSLFLKHLSFLQYLINGKNDLPVRAALSHTSGNSFRNDAPPDPVHHNTAQFENYIMRCIEHGRLDLVETALADIHDLGLNMGRVSHSSLSALKNTFISSTTLACRAAVQGGMDYDRAMSLSDAYLRQADSILTVQDHYRLFTEMVRDFTRRTRQLHLCTNSSRLVRDVARSINGKLNQKITVEELAREQGVTPSYLSHHFRKETGLCLTDYIARQKIDEAIRLMQTTEMTLAQIAYQLSFSSQSYFHATFKKIAGINPGKFPRRAAVPGTIGESAQTDAENFGMPMANK